MNKSAFEIVARVLCPAVLAMTASVCAMGQAATARPSPQPSPGNEVHARVTETLIDSGIRDDQAVDQMLAAYSPKVKALDTVIGNLKGELRKGGTGAGSLGNFVTNGILAEARKKLKKPIALAVTNGGGLRKNTIGEGPLRERDIFELLPFENALVAFDLTGAQVMDLLNVVIGHRDAQAGARIKYRTNAEKKAEVVSARLLVDGWEKEIDPAATYTVISIDYLFKRQSSTPSESEGNYSVFTQAKNIQPLGITIRDAIIDYVKSETAAGREIKAALDGRFVFEKSEASEGEPPR